MFLNSKYLVKTSVLVYGGKLLNDIVVKPVEHDQKNAYVGVRISHNGETSTRTASRREA